MLANKLAELKYPGEMKFTGVALRSYDAQQGGKEHEGVQETEADRNEHEDAELAEQ